MRSLSRVVQACDSFGNVLTSGGATFAAEIGGMSDDAISITDRQDGTYALQYSIPSEGIYTLLVTLQGRHLRGSPASITVFRCCPQTVWDL